MEKETESSTVGKVTLALIILGLGGIGYYKYSEQRQVIDLSEKSAATTEKLKKENAELQAQYELLVNSSPQSIKSDYLDTTGIYKSPVRVISAKFIDQKYSSYKSVNLTYRNVSTKTISAIKFEFYGENSFGEPASYVGSSSNDGVSGGFTDDPVKPKGTDSGVWEIYSKDGKKVIGARAYEVVFSDGTKWRRK